MSNRSSSTCYSCSRMLSSPHLLERACSPEGLDVTLPVEEFQHALELGCYLCLKLHEHAEVYKDFKYSSTFYHLRKDELLWKNVKCRKACDYRDSADGLEVPQAFRFDAMVIILGSLDALQDVRFDVQALEDDPAARWISARPLDPEVNRPEALNLAREWLSHCVAHHKRCGVAKTLVARSAFSPKRLLKINSEASGCIKVSLQLMSDNEHQRYAALSYCWGSMQTYTLKLSNLEAWCINIPVMSLPQTLRDAVYVTSRLGLEYLWVDALCIIQDSITDKDGEIAVMGDIYGNAELTISAASSRACTEGFLQRRFFEGPSMPEMDFSTLQFPCPEGAPGEILVKEHRTDDVGREPIFERGWTLQEQMLSSTVLTFDSWQVWWECLEEKKCDHGNPHNINSNGSSIDNLSIHGLTEHVMTMSREPNHNPDFLWKAWMQIVTNYSMRILSVETDRLPALSGLASKLSDLWGCPYHAGLWEKRLIEGLGWSVLDHSALAPEDYCAPSWSWASAVGSIIWGDRVIDEDHVEENPLEHTRIVKCTVTLANEAVPFGQVTDGSLIIEGLAQWINWDGQEPIEAKDLDPAFCPSKTMEIGSPLYPEGITALVTPDYSQTSMFENVKEEGHDDGPQPEIDENIFYMGGEQAQMNESQLPVLLLVISRNAALMLGFLEDDTYERLGLCQFRSEADLKAYFEGSDLKRVIIR